MLCFAPAADGLIRSYGELCVSVCVGDTAPGSSVCFCKHPVCLCGTGGAPNVALLDKGVLFQLQA